MAGDRAIEFTLTDIDGKSVSTHNDLKRPETLFFFCGCEACHALAKEWGTFQRAGIIPSQTTTVVFAGDAGAARSFLATSGLDKAQTRVLPDPDLHVTFDLYRVNPCPRVFVLSKDHVIAWTNIDPATAPQKAPAAAIAARTMQALSKVHGLAHED